MSTFSKKNDNHFSTIHLPFSSEIDAAMRTNEHLFTAQEWNFLGELTIKNAARIRRGTVNLLQLLVDIATDTSLPSAQNIERKTAFIIGNKIRKLNFSEMLALSNTLHLLATNEHRFSEATWYKHSMQHIQ